VDCVYANSVNGCDGGWPTKAFRYVKNNQILTEASYPYTAKDQNCKKARKTSNTNYPISTYRYLNFAGDCLKAQKKLAIQPLAIAVDASRWGSYSSGIFTCKSTAINHGVLLVGYDANGKLEDQEFLGGQLGRERLHQNWTRQLLLSLRRSLEDRYRLMIYPPYPSILPLQV
jgi:C1A family cysteine protease